VEKWRCRIGASARLARFSAQAYEVLGVRERKSTVWAHISHYTYLERASMSTILLLEVLAFLLGRMGGGLEGKLSALGHVGEGWTEAEVNLLRSHEAALGDVSFVRDVCISHHHPKAAHAR